MNTHDRKSERELLRDDRCGSLVLGMALKQSRCANVGSYDEIRSQLVKRPNYRSDPPSDRLRLVVGQLSERVYAPRVHA